MYKMAGTPEQRHRATLLWPVWYLSILAGISHLLARAHELTSNRFAQERNSLLTA